MTATPRTALKECLRLAELATPPGEWKYSPWHVEEGPSAVLSTDGWAVCHTSSDTTAALIAAAINLLRTHGKALSEALELQQWMPIYGERVTAEQARGLLTYDPDTGAFTWKMAMGNGVNPGDVAGGLDFQGYTVINISGRKYRAHRLAWLYTYGRWPAQMLDHINGIRSDNRIANLRAVTIRQNGQNRDIHREGKLLGAHFHKGMGKWVAKIHVNGGKQHLGTFKTAEEAHAVYMAACARLHVAEKDQPK